MEASKLKSRWSQGWFLLKAEAENLLPRLSSSSR